MKGLDMTRKEFTRKIGKNLGCTMADAGVIIDGVFEVLADAIKDGERVYIAGFGIFHSKLREAHKAQNPKTGEEIDIPLKRKLIFKPSMSLKHYINEGVNDELLYKD
jgi:DNA-binding protein HU-beta